MSTAVATRASRVEEPLAVAVIGASPIGRRHTELVAAEPTCRLAAVVDPAAQAHAWRHERGVTRRHELRDLLAAGGLDAVILATPNALHVEQAIACVKAGLPALIERPVAPTVRDALRVEAVVADASVAVLVGHYRQHIPVIERALEIIASGQLGPIVAVQGAADFHKPDVDFKEAPWRAATDSGPVLINLVHEVGVLRALVGEITAVQALDYKARPDFEVEDTTAVALDFEGSALGTVLFSYAAAAPISREQMAEENPGHPAYPDMDCYVLAFGRGALAIPPRRMWRYPPGTTASW